MLQLLRGSTPFVLVLVLATVATAPGPAKAQQDTLGTYTLPESAAGVGGLLRGTQGDPYGRADDDAGEGSAGLNSGRERDSRAEEPYTDTPPLRDLTGEPPRRRPQDGDIILGAPEEIRDGGIAPPVIVTNRDGDLSEEGRFYAPDDAAPADGRRSGPAPQGARGDARAGLAPASRRPDPLPSDAELAARDTAAEIAPFAPVGLRMGAFVFYPEASLETVYTDNVFEAAGDPQSDVALELRPSMRVQSDWRRHAFAAETSARVSFHREFESEDDREFNASAEGRLDIRRGTRLTTRAAYALSQGSRSSLDVAADTAELPDIHEYSAEAEFSHRFNRLEVTLRGGLRRSDYENAILADGTIDNNDDQDSTEHRLAIRASYEFSPRAQAFVEGEAARETFEAASEGDGLKRDFDTRIVRGGLRLSNGSKLSGEASLGYLVADADEREIPDVEGIVLDANLTWRPTELTTLRLDARTDIDPTTQAGSLGALENSVSLGVRHLLRRYLTVTAGLSFTREDFEGLDLVEDEITASVGLEYAVTRELVLNAGYEHTRFDSSDPGRDYYENELRFGMRVQR